MDWQHIITAILSAACSGGIIVYLFEWRERKRQAGATAKKINAEANSIQAGADNQTLEGAFKLIETLTNQLKLQEKKGEAMEVRMLRLERIGNRALNRIAYLMDGIRKLISQIERHNERPEWQPCEWQPEEEE